MNIPLENLEILQKSINELKKENQELKDTNMKYAKLIDDFQTKNMRLEKALEIINKKNFDVEGFKEALKSAIFLQLETYNNWVRYDKEKMLTQQEYELLKEVIENASK